MSGIMPKPGLIRAARALALCACAAALAVAACSKGTPEPAPKPKPKGTPAATAAPTPTPDPKQQIIGRLTEEELSEKHVPAFIFREQELLGSGVAMGDELFVTIPELVKDGEEGIYFYQELRPLDDARYTFLRIQPSIDQRLDLAVGEPGPRQRVAGFSTRGPAPMFEKIIPEPKEYVSLISGEKCPSPGRVEFAPTEYLTPQAAIFVKDWAGEKELGSGYLGDPLDGGEDKTLVLINAAYELDADLRKKLAGLGAEAPAASRWLLVGSILPKGEPPKNKERREAIQAQLKADHDTGDLHPVFLYLNNEFHACGTLVERKGKEPFIFTSQHQFMKGFSGDFAYQVLRPYGEEKHPIKSATTSVYPDADIVICELGDGGKIDGFSSIRDFAPHMRVLPGKTQGYTSLMSGERFEGFAVHTPDDRANSCPEVSLFFKTIVGPGESGSGWVGDDGTLFIVSTGGQIPREELDKLKEQGLVPPKGIEHIVNGHVITLEELEGEKPSKDGTKGIFARIPQWFRKGAKGGDANAMFSYGIAMVNGDGQPRDEKEGARWVRKAARAGQVDAMAAWGDALFNGLGVKRDPAEAASWIEKAAEKGQPLATLWLGIMRLEGLGAEKDEAKGVELFKKAAEMGLPGANHYLGEALREGRGAPKDLDEAARRLFAAAQLGDPGALAELIELAREGVVMKTALKMEDDKVAAGFLRRAKASDPAHMLMAGICAREGFGVAADPVQTRLWIRAAAEKGYPPAMHELALLYLRGTGEPESRGIKKSEQDGVKSAEQKAVEWLRKAAELRYPPSMMELAGMLEAGRGAAKDEKGASEWRRNAARQGDLEAQKFLTEKGIEWDDPWPQQDPEAL